jgi:NADH:ubiquinone oxidoreductase subunit 6 (subunit J)
MNVLNILFYFFEGVAAASALGIIFIRNVFYGALLLIVCLLSLAALYVLLFAEFVAVTQILIYAGGILIVIIFGIMLTSKISGKPLVVEHAYILSGTLVTGMLFALLVYFFGQQTFSAKGTANDQTGYDMVNMIGMGFMRDFLLPFEVAGILLLVALIGAAVIASTAKSKKM